MSRRVSSTPGWPLPCAHPSRSFRASALLLHCDLKAIPINLNTRVSSRVLDEIAREPIGVIKRKNVSAFQPNNSASLLQGLCQIPDSVYRRAPELLIAFF